MEEARVTSKIMPIQPEESQGEKQPVKAKAAKPAPELAPEATQWFSLNEFLRNELVAHKGHPKVTALDIVEKYQAAATTAGKVSQPKFTVQRLLRALMLKNFPSAVYSNSTDSRAWFGKASWKLQQPNERRQP